MIQLVHARYIKRGAKFYGPYVYKSIRDKEGKVKNIYLGSPKGDVVQKSKLSVPYQALAAILFVLGFFLLQYNYSLLDNLGNNIIDTNKQLFKLTGFATKEDTSLPSYPPIEVISNLDSLEEEFVIHVGQQFYLKVLPDWEKSIFSDGTRLFDINPEGIIVFTPTASDVGDYTTTIFVDSTNGKFKYKIVRFTIAE